MTTTGTRILIMGAFMGSLTGLLAATPGMPYDDPKDWSAWERYRAQVRHPATLFKADDLDRARANIARHAWAAAWAAEQERTAAEIVPMLTPAYLEDMAEITTPGCTGPCPGCRDKGLRWHPNGMWTWSARNPNRLTCTVCKTVFPNDAYPESVEVRSTWDPRQVFRFYGGETFVCFSYKQARPTFTGIIRRYKLGHLTWQLRTLAMAYTVNGNPDYANGARLILLRLAEVLPSYLVLAGYGYGEFADCDPHVACERINNLPTDELVCPPNRPDRKVHTGYWSASRIGSSGMDGSWVTTVTQAYDLTCEARRDGVPIYSEAERLRVERDVLLEGSYLGACDTSINNKSVGNRAGAAMVGLCVGHPGLVRFGIDGFMKTVDDWFLPDGGTSESAAYAMMTMGGIRPFGEALRDYSEPEGYTGPDGRRLVHFNACRDTRYGTCWQSLLWTLQGNLRHPPLADSYRTTGISAEFAELIALAYPTEAHRAYLAEVGGEAPAGQAARLATFYRDPDLTAPTTRLSLPDVVFPFLAQGFLRLGENGRDGLVVLDASNWGSHHHQDSLNLYLWKDGHELLTDLGYLWDHPDKRMTARTAAHNLVILGGKEQASKGRGGSMHLFGTTPQVKFMEASSEAYPEAEAYRRTCVQVDHGKGAAYVVDIFRAARGDERRDSLFHGPNHDVTATGIDLQPAAAGAVPESIAALGKNPRQAPGPAQAWNLRWKMADDYTFTAHVPAGSPDETVTIIDGWGQRDHRNTDRGTTLPYVVRSRPGASPADAFVTLYEGAKAGREVVRSAVLLTPAVGAAADAVAIAVQTDRGVDLILSQMSSQPLRITWDGAEVTSDARLAVLHLPAAAAAPFAVMVEGTALRHPTALTLSAPTPCLNGTLAAADGAEGASWFDLAGAIPKDAALTGATLLTTGDDGIERAWPIRRQEEHDGVTRVFTQWNHEGFPARPAKTWRLSSVVAASADTH